jgi:hypothetical protein
VETRTLLKGSRVIKLVASSDSADDTAGSASSSAHDMESDHNKDSDKDGVEEECDNVTESLLTADSGDKRGSLVSDNVTDSLSAGGGKKQGSLASALDTMLYEILKEAKLECFATLEDAIPFVEA